MPFSDFTRYFSRLEFCHLGPESGSFGRSFKQDERKRRWEMTREEGEWVKHSTAGGCRNNARTFHMNPQYRVQVIDPDETDDDNTGTIIIGLMQKSRREVFQEHHTIGYSIYRVSDLDNSYRIAPLSRGYEYTVSNLHPFLLFAYNFVIPLAVSFIVISITHTSYLYSRLCNCHRLSPYPCCFIFSAYCDQLIPHCLNQMQSTNGKQETRINC
ncbi:unnamed protein product [Echinostoma caproni]|uniref:Calpain_III domain-containing protein n=1 Tax=Echinostoma caproni TaxID=27848 RepID=A0A183A0S7_9TREM|nr:unnamed protein product [Echinostoma caproni]